MSVTCGVCQRPVEWCYSLTRYDPTTRHWEPVRTCQGCLPPSDDSDDVAIQRRATQVNRYNAAQQRGVALRAQRAADAILAAGVAAASDESIPRDVLDVAAPLANGIEPDQLTLPPGGDDLPEGEPC